MIFGVLGTLLLRPTNVPVRVGGAKPRAMLALLLVNRNLPVRMDRIVGELWPESPPDSAIANVRTYASALRQALSPHGDRLSTRPGAYTLDVDDDEFDAAVFDATARLARSSRKDGDIPAALALFDQALALWRGNALEDVPAGPVLMSYGAALGEARLKVLEEHLDTRFESGDTDGSIGVLRELTAAHPTRETAWHLLIRSLYRLNDRAAALQAYQEVRAALAQHLGLDPGPDLQALHVDILRGRPAAGPSRASAVTRTPAPRQLPGASGLLVGRTAELLRIRAALTRPADGRSGVPRVVAVVGTGGIGKSSLAVAAARALADGYPDGQLYIDLQGSSPGMRPLEPTRVFGIFLRALGVPEERISSDREEAAAWYRTYCADRRLLVVLDNAVDHRQAQALVPPGPGCATLITSRHPLDTLDCVDRIALDGLPPAAAVDLLRSLAGADRVDAELAAAQDLVRLCGLLPLAIRVAGARLARHPDLRLNTLVGRLRRAHSRLDELGFADLDVRPTFEVGYHALQESDPDGHAALLFRRMGLLRTAAFPTIVAAGLLGVDDSVAERALDLLLDHGFVERHGRNHRVHDLLRVYAGDLAQAHETQAEAGAALARVVDRYVRLIRRSPVLYRPLAGDRPPDESLPDDPVPQTSSEAEEWMTDHLPTLGELAAQLAARPATARLAYDLLRPLSWRLWVYHPAESVHLHAPLLAADADDAAPDMAAPMLCSVANAHLCLHQYDEAAACARRALDMLPRLDEDTLRVRVLSVNAWAHLRTGAPQRAIGYFGEVIALYARMGLVSLLAVSLNNAAQATFALGRYADSLALLRRSLALTRQRNDRALRAAVLDSLAMVRARMRRWRAVRWHTDAAIEISEQISDVLTLTSALQYRSLARQALGQPASAIADADAAVRVARRAERPSLELEALRILSGVLWLAGDPRAIEAVRRAEAFAATLRPGRP
ncbi:NB-ARC domain-containing protein [Micromonospora sp. A3M-1-15]|uniref:AfsR/SARP family transcriptional regulator n=1 Tax=Micromonospora sp. A3M-1-15 TaxID=2962035 RepID=UPI0020B6BE7B|nr:BTAD domain-containing putative transcriptional regulator [Micromonospora sp. A3M-1-15]MCP3786724.1 NB-ARC domain-containing protein [Micromonospora sp. A3M-1-15]